VYLKKDAAYFHVEEDEAGEDELEAGQLAALVHYTAPTPPEHIYKQPRDDTEGVEKY
jgi:hypothetical protein